MTSQSDLPVWAFGDIWDGVTEYAEQVPGHVGIYFTVGLALDGSRRVINIQASGNIPRGLSLVLALDWEIIGVASEFIQPGDFYAYDGSGSHEPVNQIPHQQDFLNHCCTFAHELLVDHQPHSARLRHVDSWDIAPDIALDVASIEKNRVGMRYYRGVLGYYYDQIVRFSSHPNNPADVGQFEIDWRTELAEMQALDRYVCGECRDESGGSRLRDFIHYCNVSEWDSNLAAVEQLTIGSAIQYRARLPKIDRSNPDDLRPHRTQNVRTWVSNVPSADSGWRSMMRDFDAAVKRYDRDTSVRMPSGTHVPS